MMVPFPPGTGREQVRILRKQKRVILVPCGLSAFGKGSLSQSRQPRAGLGEGSRDPLPPTHEKMVISL